MIPLNGKVLIFSYSNIFNVFLDLLFQIIATLFLRKFKIGDSFYAKHSMFCDPLLCPAEYTIKTTKKYFEYVFSEKNTL